MDKESEKTVAVFYTHSWGAFHILIGIIFSTVFILGALILNDLFYLVHLLFSGGLIFMGTVRLQKPYLVCAHQNIQVTGHFGQKAYNYSWANDRDLKIKGNRLYLKDKKLKFNSWFTNQDQYKNMIRFYAKSESLSDELQD